MICHLDYLSVLCACKAFKVSVKQKEHHFISRWTCCWVGVGNFLWYCSVTCHL